MKAKTFREMADENSMRSPSWRYNRAITIIESQGGRWHKINDDRETIQCVRYLTKRAQVHRMDMSPDNIERVLWAQSRDTHLAYTLFNLPASDPNRYILEARLLTGETNEQISETTAILPEVVDTYERLFFSVRDRLHKENYILANVIGKVFQSGLSTFNPELLAKYFAYFAGPVILDVVLSGFSAKRRIANDDEVLGFLDAKIATNWRVQTATMSTMLQPGKFDIRAIFEGYGQLLAVEARAQAAPEHSDWVGSFIKTLRNITPIPRGSEATSLENTPLTNYSVGHVELRAEEQLRAASRNGLPYYEQLATFKPPSPDQNVNGNNSDKPPGD